METLTYSSGRASGCDSPGLLNTPLERWTGDYNRTSVRLIMPNFRVGITPDFYVEAKGRFEAAVEAARVP